LCAGILVGTGVGTVPASAQSTFSDVEPIFSAKCVACHGATEAAVGLNVDTWSDLMRGSDYGEAVIAFDPAHSLLLELETKTAKPHSALIGGALTEGEVARLTQWVADGARSASGEVPFARMEAPLYSANQASATVSVIDTRAQVVARHVHFTELGYSENAKPHHIVVEPDGSAWYVSLIGENRVLKLDAENRVLAEAEFEVPGLMALHPTDDALYLGRSMSAVNAPQRIGRIARSTMEVDEVGVFFPRPHALAIAPDGGKIYTASLGTNQIAAVDSQTDGVQLTTLDGPQHAPVQFAVASDGMQLVAATQLTGRVMFFDLADPDHPALQRSVEVAAQPWHPVYTPDGASVWVASKEADQVTELDARTGEILRVVKGPGLAQPQGSAFRPDGRFLYISSLNARGRYTPRHDLGDNALNGTVSVIDTRTGTIVKVIEVENGASGLGIRAPVPSPHSLRRAVTGIPVAGPDGMPYDHPWFGGLNVPRPQFNDIDGDGDVDLFLQELANELAFFENEGTAAQPRFVWKTDRFQGLDVGDWNRFVDLDNDGDLDLLAEKPFSYVRYYRNEGDAGSSRFTLAVDSLKNAAQQPIFADRQNIPNLTDIDCDGRWDLFLGRVDGTVARYEEVGVDAAGVPLFELVTERFENIEIIGALSGGLHGANSMSFSDADNDGDQDLFWGDFFEPGVLFIENTGTCAEPNLSGEPVPLPATERLATSGYNVTALADIDGDADQDLFVGVLGGAFNPNLTTIENLLFLERKDSGLWEVQTRRYLTMLDVGTESVPTFVDLDADGDLDLLVANKIDPSDLRTSMVYVFTNVGSARAPRFRQTDSWELLRQYHQVPAFGDLDGDGDEDMLLGTWNKGVAYFRNDGTPERADFVLADSVLIKLTRGSNSAPALVDIDGDGDLDLFVGESSGELNFYRNVGDASRANFELVSDDYQDIDPGRRSFPTFVDWDGDGDMDLFLGSEAGGLQLWRNDGGGAEPHFVRDEEFGVDLPRMSTPVFVDIDGDGDLDLLAGTLGGGVVWWEGGGL
jgi:DNA-binding beta-propeller fold protein YncE